MTGTLPLSGGSFARFAVCPVCRMGIRSDVKPGAIERELFIPQHGDCPESGPYDVKAMEADFTRDVDMALATIALEQGKERAS